GGAGGLALSLEVVRAALAARFDGPRPPHGFLSGGVTFCAMMPMRSIPFRVVALLGMDEGAFPRGARPVGFDLAAQQPRPGDRSPRHDDRQLFLEALVSARDALLITYTGRSIRDNAELPPSVVVSELLDVLSESFALSEAGGDGAAAGGGS